jgi:hypothetical protein
MELYDYILRFGDEEHSLSAKNGIPLDELIKLLDYLNKTLRLAKDDKIVLSEVIGNSYAISLTTNSYSAHNKISTIHEKISKNDYSGFNANERKYAFQLKNVLNNKYYLQGFSASDKNKRTQIDEIIIPQKPDYYFERGSVYGIITSIGGKTLNGKASVHINDKPYEIEVSKEQEQQLIKHFKKDKLHLTITKKIGFDSENIISAVLEDYEIVSNLSFLEASQLLLNKYPDGIFDHIEDSTKLSENIANKNI